MDADESKEDVKGNKKKRQNQEEETEKNENGKVRRRLISKQINE